MGVEPPKRRREWWSWTGFGGQTLWDWLQLLSALSIPIVLALAALWFSTQQDRRQETLEDQRAESARRIEELRARDAALGAYLDQMGQLLLDEGLRDPEAKGEARTLARLRTLMVLGRVDPRRKAEVMQFLIETGLVQQPRVDERGPIIGLRGADLRGTDLSDADLRGADLRGADLADADLSDADLSDADLHGANLFVADLPDADLRSADLGDADLRGANLGGADLAGAEHITNDALEVQASSLVYATMPDGSEHP